MDRIHPRGEKIRRFILDHVEAHPRDIARLAAAKFGVSRQAINKHLQNLTAENCLAQSGRTRNRSYRLAPLVDWQRIYEIAPSLADDVVWTADLRPALGALPANVMNIWHTVFTEIFNNAMEHSAGRRIVVRMIKTAASTLLTVHDDGIGIFAKIRAAFDLPDEQHAVLELAKGKLTTDPRNHSGEGIFFASRMVDLFIIVSGGVFFTHAWGQAEDFILEHGLKPGRGTAVAMLLRNHAARTTKRVYDQYTSGEDFGFTRTVVPVHLARYGDDALVSRSQAKRVLARVEQFKVVVLDFQGVEAIGQAFADEIFRVFTQAHPEIELVPMNAGPGVKAMIAHATGHAVSSS